MINIEVAYAGAEPEQQSIIALSMPLNCTVIAAIQASGILQQYPEIDIAVNKVGVFGKLVALDSVLRGGDRVEIYRPLLVDPKYARIQRAKRQKAKTKIKAKLAQFAATPRY